MTYSVSQSIRTRFRSCSREAKALANVSECSRGSCGFDDRDNKIGFDRILSEADAGLDCPIAFATEQIAHAVAGGYAAIAATAALTWI